MPVRVFFHFNDRDAVYVATSPDVAGLVVEERRYEDMKGAVEQLVPMLLADGECRCHVPIELISHA